MATLSDAHFVQRQYGTAENLDARAALHARYSSNNYGWFCWVYDQFELHAGDCVLELGCGTGELWARNAERVPSGVRFMLTDVSQGMLDQAATRLADAGLALTFGRVDAQELPYVAGRFDVVIANHMLYHVPDRNKALAEVARVLAPGGRFYATTIGQGHMQELATLAQAVAPGVDVFAGFRPDRFSLENAAAQVAPVLQGVEVRRYPDELRITAVEPLLAYYASLRLGESFERCVPVLRRHLESILAANGAIVISKDSGMVLARNEPEAQANSR